MKEKFQKTEKDAEIAEFLDRVRPLYEKALQQNELYDIFEDKFGLLADEDHGPGNKNENNITEFQSFTYWKYSNNKVASCIDWVPGEDNVVAVAITEPLSFNDWLNNRYIFIFFNIILWDWRAMGYTFSWRFDCKSNSSFNHADTI